MRRIRLNENDLARIVRRVIKEQETACISYQSDTGNQAEFCNVAQLLDYAKNSKRTDAVEFISDQLGPILKGTSGVVKWPDAKEQLVNYFVNA
jgi:hypothetical protein